jgi:hypothetical protein
VGCQDLVDTSKLNGELEAEVGKNLVENNYGDTVDA